MTDELMLNVAVCVSGGGTNLQTLIDAKQAGRLPLVRLAVVIASRPGTKAEARAKAAGIPCLIISKRDYENQEAYDLAMIDALRPYEIGLVVLAGFLTRLGDSFISSYEGRIINVHPSLLPLFGGQGFYGIKPHEAVLAAGHKVSGATVHLVTAIYDEGPILLQREVSVLEDDSPESLQARVMQEAEHVILAEAVDRFSRGEWN